MIHGLVSGFDATEGKWQYKMQRKTIFPLDDPYE